MPDDASDFVNIGDEGLITVTTSVGFGEGGFGEGGFGGDTITVEVGSSSTVWTNISTP